MGALTNHTTLSQAKKCACPHRAAFSVVFKPTGTPLKGLEIIRLAPDGLDALHLCDGEGMTQEEAGIRLGDS